MKATIIKLLLSADVSFVSGAVSIRHAGPRQGALYRQRWTLQTLERRHA